jgi:hypothetical protein
MASIGRTKRMKTFRFSARIAAYREARETYKKYLIGTADYTGFGTHLCPCGCNVFKICVMFEDYEISWYTCSMYCYNCGAKLTAPTELDRPVESLVTV